MIISYIYIYIHTEELASNGHGEISAKSFAGTEIHTKFFGMQPGTVSPVNVAVGKGAIDLI